MVQHDVRLYVHLYSMNTAWRLLLPKRDGRIMSIGERRTKGQSKRFMTSSKILA